MAHLFGSISFTPILQPAASQTGFALAWGVMAVIALSLLVTLYRFVRGSGSEGATLDRPSAAIPLLALMGMGIAGYLSYVELFAVQAVCGPVGDCNAVQTSHYARLLGVVPVAVLGAAGYLLLTALWLLVRLGPVSRVRLAMPAAFAGALFGTLFSAYLTYLEIFVIRAVCLWCLASAVLISLILLASLQPTLATLASSDEPTD